MNESVSYIIPCYNSEETIVPCLNSIINQVVDNDYEIIIIDSSKNNRLENIIRKYDYKNINIITSKYKLFAGQARNVGLNKSSGYYFALIDSDIILPPDWTKVMLKNYKQNCFGSSGLILSGSLKNAIKTKSYLKDSLFILMCSQFLESNRITERKFLGGSNLFFDNKIKNIIEFPNVRLSEDVIMTKNANDKGVKLLTIGPNVVEHITTKYLSEYSFQLGIASYIISKESNEDSTLSMKIYFGSFYKLLGIIISIIKYSPSKLFNLFFFFPGVFLGTLFYHIGIIYSLIKSRRQPFQN